MNVAPNPIPPRAILGCLLAGISLQTTCTAHAAPPAPHPNFVYILADDLGYGDVHALNPSGKIATPHMDQLIGSGLAFTEAHSSSAVCTPSRYSILTGRYNWRSALKHGVLEGFSPPLIEEGRLTVAEMLHEHGYATAVIGKWHLGLGWAHRPLPVGEELGNENLGRTIDFTKPISRGPTTLGFDEYFGISASLDMPPYTFIANNRVTALPTIEKSFPWTGVGKETHHTRVGPAAPDFDTVDVLPTLTQHAVEYIRAHAREGKPFFLYLPLTAPHTPLAVSKEWRGRSGLNDYADFVMETDAAIGEVLAAIDASGAGNNTVVLLASDNGCSPAADYPFLTTHGHDPSAGRRGYKADIFDGGHRTPLVVRWAGHVAAGSRSNAFVCLDDFMATCADIVGVKLPDNAAEDSISFLPEMEGKPGRRDTLVLHSINGSFGIRQGQWKLEFCPDSGGWSYPRPGKDSTKGWPRWQLYDLAADPAEQKNVLDQYPEVVQRLGKLLRQYVLEGRSTPGAPQHNITPARWPQTAWLDQFK